MAHLKIPETPYQFGNPPTWITSCWYTSPALAQGALALLPEERRGPATLHAPLDLGGGLWRVDTLVLPTPTRNKAMMTAREFHTIRTRQGWSTQQLAALLGCAAQSIYRWEAGERRISGDLALLMTILDRLPTARRMATERISNGENNA